MAKRIIKKIGGDRIGSGGKMTVQAHGYGYSTHDVSKVRRTNMTFGGIVPMYQLLLPTGSRLRMKMDALITSNALLYQLYGSAKFQLDVFSSRMALYNPRMLLNLNDQGYEIKDIKFPQMKLETVGISSEENISNKQINPSTLIRHLGIASNGLNNTDPEDRVTRYHMAMWLIKYYHIIKEYYANKQEKVGVMIHNAQAIKTITDVVANNNGTITTIYENTSGGAAANVPIISETVMQWTYVGDRPEIDDIEIMFAADRLKLRDVFINITYGNSGGVTYITANNPTPEVTDTKIITWWSYVEYDELRPRLQQYDLKAIDRMMMKIMANVENIDPILITDQDELPFSASFKRYGTKHTINSTQEGIAIGTYQSDVFNNWLDNATINNLTSRSKVKVDENGEFSIDMLNITQKLYNYDMRIGITDGTLDEWREMTYGQKSKSKSLKPVYEGGLSKEIVFDMVVSTASTEEEPLGSIASRGAFGNKHKGGYAQIEAPEETLVMVLAKITPRLVYNQGNDWTTNLKTLDDLHKPALDKIGYQNLITDQIAAFETRVQEDGVLLTYSAGKQPAYQWYRTNYDDALANMAESEDYKVFGRSYEAIREGKYFRIKDLTTYIDPMKFNDVFALKSLDALNFDVQVGIDAQVTMVMSEEVIPGL